MRKAKYIMTYAMPLLALAVLCSCGIQEEDRQAQKKETVEMVEPVTTAVFKNSKTTEKTDYLENDYIRVWQNYDDHTWMQENLDGTERKPLKKAGLTLVDEYFYYSVVWLTDDWIYLILDEDPSKTEEKPQKIFCRIPVQGKGETVYDTANKEILFQFDMENDCDWNTLYDFMVTDSYILYRYWAYAGDPHKKEYYRYDFDTKKTSLAFSVDDDESVIVWENGLPMTLNHCFFLQDYVGSIYEVSFDTFEKTKIEPDPEDVVENAELLESLEDYQETFYSELTVHDDCLYFTENYVQIFKYNGNSVTCVMNTVADDIELLKQADGWFFDNIYAWKDRLYIGIWAFSDMSEETDYSILVSADFSNLKQWTVEEGFMEYAMKKDFEIEYNLEDGKLYFAMYDEEQDFAYDLETKKVEKVPDTYIW